MTLLDLQNGQKGVILKVRGSGAFRRRIIEMGFVVGKTVEVIKKAPLQDPIEYSIMGYNLSLRSGEASLIEVIPVTGHHQEKESDFDGVIYTESHRNGNGHRNRHRKGGGFHAHDQDSNPAIVPGKLINVALVGNPNSGKTTFFNFASGSRERVGNYSGVTVDAKEARFFQDGYRFNITDLPGTYSISAYTPEEIFVQKFISEQMPDVVINVVDASNLERNLYLTTQLIDMDIRVVMVLNMYDELEKKGDAFDYESLGKMIGIPMIPAVSSKGKGIRETFNKVIEVFEDRDEVVRHFHINYGTIAETAIKEIQSRIRKPENQDLTDRISSRFLSIRMLENDPETRKTISNHCKNQAEILQAAMEQSEKLSREYNDSPEAVITDLRYGFINGALKETLKPAGSIRKRTSQAIDFLLTHKYLGFPFFLAFMWIMFSATFFLGSYPMEWIEAGVESLSEYLNGIMASGPLKDLLINGIISGVGGVLVFLPNIMLLFFFISIMEDTGYMSRAVFIMDKLMHKIGLHGKSFIPLLMGFGCNVPAIMATRTLANRNDRLLTMLINPFMSCSARLPIYVLFISAFFSQQQGTVLFLIYFTGVAVAVATAMLFKRTLFKGEEVPFVMELPPYRMPTHRAIVSHMWSKAVQYLKKISGVILVASIVIWALGYFPAGVTRSAEHGQQISEIRDRFNADLQLLAHETMDDETGSTQASTFAARQDSLISQKETALAQAEARWLLERQESSYIGRLGRFVLPVMEPLGFDWKMTISILSGIAAKEIVVSTLAVLYLVDENVQTQSASLIDKLQNQIHTDGPKMGEPVFTPLVALSFMLFVLLYFPCIGVIAAISRESGSWKWGMFTVFYTTMIAWLVSFAVYQIGSLII